MIPNDKQCNITNRNAPPDWQCVIGNLSFSGDLPSRLNFNTTQAPLSIPCYRAKCQRYGKLRLTVVKSKATESTWSGLAPTEPNWTEEPAVINDGDIQHFSGMVAIKRGFTVSNKNQKKVTKI